VAIYASKDTEDLAKEKGFQHGLWEMLGPFGERIQGKVAVRDSNGVTKTWDDFSIRFTKFGENVEQPEPVQSGLRSPTGPGTVNGQSTTSEKAPTPNRLLEVEELVNRHLTYAERSFLGIAQPTTPTKQGVDVEANSAYYALYLRRLLSGMPVACHDTFAHPVCSVIAISSRNPAPIQTFREIYKDTTQGDKRMPSWVDGDYLRYYVLVHDEDSGDIGKSMALFEQMKRHLGLHCHLLRLRSSQSAETDDDSVPLPRSDWMTAAEELADIERSETHEDFDDPTKYIFQSDATAIQTFIREMVNQSIVPNMERNISLWNDQVASKRKGISGRFMNLSKRWGGFGGSSRNSTSGSGGSSNYDAQGFYSAETPEAIMRKLADYAFMLRDWKLAMQTYDILRSDFNNDKAWKYHAAASEMAAFSLLIMPPAMSSRTKLDNVNAMLEQAFYSYHTRCSMPASAMRTVALGLELLRLRGGPAIHDSVRWGMRLMEARLVGPVGEALLRERLAIGCATKQGIGSMAWGSWRRKSALWSVLAAEAWLDQDKFIQAQRCLNEARQMYSMLQSDEGISGFGEASEFMARLNRRLKDGLTTEGAGDGAGEADGEAVEEYVVEVVDQDVERLSKRRSRRASIIGMGGSLETAPLQTQPGGEAPPVGDSAPGDGFG